MRHRFPCLLLTLLLLQVPPRGSAQPSTELRRPRGTYVVVDIDTNANTQQKANPSITTTQLHSYFQSLYSSLLANPAASGLTIQVAWSRLNPNPPNSSPAYDWTWMDEVFEQAAVWNLKNPTHTPKGIQVQVFPGYFTPDWVLNQIHNCDSMFNSPPVVPPSDCGKVTFTDFAEPHLGLNVFPLPWNPIYKSAFRVFLKAFAVRYLGNPAFVSIDIAGPTAASSEIIVPTNARVPPQAQFGNITAEDMWLQLLPFAFPGQPAYWKSDQAFIDEWNAAIDMFGEIFSGLTLIATPGSGLPDFPGYTLPAALAPFCPSPNRDCGAEATILTHFADPSVGGHNAKAVQSSGLGAGGNLGEGDLSPKRLSLSTAGYASPSARVMGGLQFGTSVARAVLNEGCVVPFPPKPSDIPAGCTIAADCSNNSCIPVVCIPQACLAPGVTTAGIPAKSVADALNNYPNDLISIEQGLYNVLTSYFAQTPVAPVYAEPAGTTPMNYLQIYAEDFLYAAAHAGTPGLVVPNSGPNQMLTAQFLLNQASQSLLGIAEDGPVITSVSSFFSTGAPISANSLMTIAGINLAPPGYSLAGILGLFGSASPQQLEGTSVTVNGVPAAIYYASPELLVVLTPSGKLSGSAQVEVISDGSTSNIFTVAAR